MSNFRNEFLPSAQSNNVVSQEEVDNTLSNQPSVNHDISVGFADDTQSNQHPTFSTLDNTLSNQVPGDFGHQSPTANLHESTGELATTSTPRASQPGHDGGIIGRTSLSSRLGSVDEIFSRRDVDAAWSRHNHRVIKCSSESGYRGCVVRENPLSSRNETYGRNCRSCEEPFGDHILSFDDIIRSTESVDNEESVTHVSQSSDGWSRIDLTFDPYYEDRWDNTILFEARQIIDSTRHFVTVNQVFQDSNALPYPPRYNDAVNDGFMETLSVHGLPINLIINMAIRVRESKGFVEKVSAVFGLCEAIRHYQPDAIRTIIGFLDSLFRFDIAFQSASESLVGFVLIILAFMGLNVRSIECLRWINDEIRAIGDTARGFNSVAQTITTHAPAIGAVILNALGFAKPTPVSQLVESCVARLDEHAAKLEEFLSQLSNDTSVILVEPWKADVLISKSDAILKESILLATHKEYTALGPNIPRLQAALKMLKSIKDRVINASATRVEPVVIQLYGDPGVGKSFLVKSIVNAISKQLHIPPEIYARGLTKHWDSFVGQYFIVYDDFLSDVQGEDMKELIHLVSSNPFVVPMANVEQKGLRFASPFIILCSNLRNAPLNNNSISNPHAIDRRRHFLVEVKRRAGHEHLDGYQDGASHLELTLRNPLFREEKNPQGVVDYKKSITFEWLVNAATQQYKQHVAIFERRQHDERIVRENYLNRDCSDEEAVQQSLVLPVASFSAEAKTIALFGAPGLGKSTLSRSIQGAVDFRSNPTPSRQAVLIIDDPRTPDEIAQTDELIRHHFDNPVWKNILLIANPEHLKNQLLTLYGKANDALAAFNRRLYIYTVKKSGLINKQIVYSDLTTNKKVTKADILDHICDKPAEILVTYVIPADLTPPENVMTQFSFDATWKTLWACSSVTDLMKTLGVSGIKLVPHLPLLRRLAAIITSDNNFDRTMTPQMWARHFNLNLIREKIDGAVTIRFTDVAMTFFNYKHERDTLEPILLVVCHDLDNMPDVRSDASEVVGAFTRLRETLVSLPTSYGIDGAMLAKIVAYLTGAAGTLLAIGALGTYVYRQGYEAAIQEASFTNSDGLNTRFRAKRRIVLTDEEADYLDIAMQLPQNRGKTVREILDGFQEKVTAGYDHYERKIFATLEESQEPTRKNVARTHIESQEPVRKNVPKTHIESQEPSRKHNVRSHIESQEPRPKRVPKMHVESQEPPRKQNGRTKIESQEPVKKIVPRHHLETCMTNGLLSATLHCDNADVVNEKERELLLSGREFESFVDKCTCKQCGSKYCTRSCAICAPELEACIDVGGLDVSRLVARSIVDLYREDGSRVNNGVMLAGHVGVTTAHGVRDDEQLTVRHFGVTYGAKVFCTKRRRDLAFYRLDKTAPPFRSLVHLLPDTVQADREVGAIVVVPQHDKLNMMMNYPVMVSAKTTYTIRGNEIEARSYNKSVSQAAFDNQFTVAGDCGSPIIAIDTTETRKFLGIHSASSVTRAYMAYLSRKEVANVLETPSFEAAADVLRYQRITPFEEPIPWGEHMELVGTAIKAPAPDKTKLWITPYVGFHEVRYQPAILSDRDPRKTIEKSVLDCLLTKWDHEPVVIPHPEYMERAVMALYNHYAKIFIKKDVKLAVLSASEALNSWKGNPMSNPIYLASSAGYPWACLKFPGVQASGKFGFVEFDQASQRYRFADNQAGRALIDSIATLNGVLKAGGHVEIPFQLHLKDECLKENKIANVGTRSICASPLDFLVVARQYLHAAHAAISSTSDYGPCMVGINPSSIDWHTLAVRLLEKGCVGFDGDYSAFDSRVPAQMFEYLAQFYEMLYEEFDSKYQIEHATVRRGLFRCLQHPLLVARGNVYRSKRGGQPSGQPATSIDNSLINTLYFLYAWQVVHERSPALQSPERFFDHCALAVYGDDNICTMTEIAAQRFTPSAVQDVLNGHLGQKVSDAAKTGLMKWTKLEDMEFLKRTFKKIGGYFTGPLVPQSFEKILSHANYHAHYYTPDDVCTSPQILAQLVDTALREASLHGEEFYNKLRSYIMKINAANHLEPPTRETWFSMFNSVYHCAKVPPCVELGEGDSATQF